MNLTFLFRVCGGIQMAGGALAFFTSSRLLNLIDLVISPATLLFAKIFGLTFLFLGFICFRLPNLATDNLSSFGKMFAGYSVGWALLFGHYLLTKQINGSFAFAMIVMNIIFAVIFFLNSRD